VSLHRLTFIPKKGDCANRIVVLTVASCMMSLSDLPALSLIRGHSLIFHASLYSVVCRLRCESQMWLRANCEIL
jgi:hypothetical protein